MKIAIFTDTYYPQLNGVTISVANYARELRKKGHTVYIFAPKFKNYKDKEKDIYRIPSIKILSSEPEIRFPVGLSYKALFQLLHMDFDIVHAHGNGPFSLLGYEFARAEGIPFIMTFHTLHNEYTHYFFSGKVVKPRAVEKLLRFMANRCDGIIAPSEKMKRKLAEFGCKKDVVVIPNFVELAQFKETQKGYLHKRLGISSATPLLLSVGRLGKEKNFSFLVEMFAQLSKNEKKSHLVFVGQGPEQQNLLQLAGEYGVKDRVHFTGRIPSKYMARVYADATIFVFASTSEVHPMVVLEAAAAGVPMVVVDDLAFANVAMDHVNAFVVPLETHIFAKKVEQLLGDIPLQGKFRTNSRKLIAKNFQAGALTDMVIAYYGKLYTKHKLQAKILRRVNRVAARGFRGIRKTRHALDKLIFSQ